LLVQNIQTLKVDNLCFFQKSFFSIKCAPFHLKIEEIFNIDDSKGKKTQTDENYFYNPFECIWLKSALNFENYGF
jgi:hypothetical protein